MTYLDLRVFLTFHTCSLTPLEPNLTAVAWRKKNWSSDIKDHWTFLGTYRGFWSFYGSHAILSNSYRRRLPDLAVWGYEGVQTRCRVYAGTVSKQARIMELICRLVVECWYGIITLSVSAFVRPFLGQDFRNIFSWLSYQLECNKNNHCQYTILLYHFILFL